MKRIIIITLLFLLPLVGKAQLNVNNVSKKLETLSSLRVGNIKLTQYGDLYHICMSGSNQIEGPESFFLGTGKESSIQTLKDLIGLMDSLGKNQFAEVDNAGHNVVIYKSSNIVLDFKFEGKAGHFWLSKNEANKFIAVLEK